MKRILIFLFSCLLVSSYGQVVDVGSAPDANDGDPIRTAFQKVNAEFALYAADSSKWIHWADSVLKIATQYDISLKANLASPTFTGTVILPSTTSIGTVSNTEIGYLDNVTSAIQTQLTARALIADTTKVDGTTIDMAGHTIRVDTGKIATQYDITGFITNAQETDGVWASDSSKVLHFADTLTGGKIATKADVASIEVGEFTETDAIWAADSAKVLHWADTLTKVASQYDIGLKLNSADALQTDNVSIKKSVNTAYVDTAYIMTVYDGNTALNLKVNTADSTAGIGHYASNYDMVTGLAAKAPQTAVDTLPGDNELTNRLALKVSIADSTAGIGHYASNYDMVTGLATKPNTSLVHLHADTIPIFIFGAGAGNDADSNAFTTSSKYGVFKNTGSDTIVVTELRVFTSAGKGNDTLSVDVMWNDTLSSTVATHLNTTALAVGRISGTITARTVGQSDTSFNNTKIPPGYIVWCATPTIVAGRKPEMLIVQISGYKIPKY